MVFARDQRGDLHLLTTLRIRRWVYSVGIESRGILFLLGFSGLAETLLRSGR